MDVKQLAQKVKEMRNAQKEYFKAKKMGLATVSADWLKKSKALESEIDKAIDEIMTGATTQNLF
jgi:hypothetical protein